MVLVDMGKKLAIMQNVYAASVAETVNTYGKLKVLDQIVERKRENQAQTASYMNAQLGVQTVEDVFAVLVDVFGCANWKVERVTDGYVATATACKLCALSKKMGGADPCHGWCLGPMAGMITDVAKGTTGGIDIKVENTLMDGDHCRVLITTG